MSDTVIEKAGGGRPKTSILIVDDRVGNLVALGALLEPLGRRVVAASSGAEALRHLLDQEFAVILLDVQMPEMDGFEAARYIRARPKTRATPIIFVTALSTDSEQVFRGYAEGAVDYILKPIDPTILISKVAIFVELYEVNAELRRHAELQAVHDSLVLAQQAGESGMWHVDLQQGKVSWSSEYAELCGLPGTSGERTDAWLVTVDPRDRARVDARLGAVLDQRGDWDEEFRIIHPTRGERWIASRGKVYSGPSGLPERFTGIAFDVSERRLAAERVSELQRATAALSSASTVADVTRELVTHGRRLAGADGAWLAARDRANGSITVENAIGMAADDAATASHPMMIGLARQALQTGRSVAHDDAVARQLVVPLVSEGVARGGLGLVAEGTGPDVLHESVELLTLGSLGAQALERARLHQAEQDARVRETLLAEVSAELEATLNLDERLERLADLLVPGVADGCVIELEADDASPARRVIVGSSPSTEMLFRTICDDEPGSLRWAEEVRRAMESGVAIRAETISELVGRHLRDDADATAAERSFPSVIVAPIRARRRSIGALTLVSLGTDAPEPGLVAEIGRRAGLALDNARLYEAQAGVASTLQRSLLPHHLPAVPRVALAARYLAAGAHAEAGGDWFEAVALSDDRVVLAVGDVVGRGTEAAAVMGQLRSAMRAYALQGLSPSSIVEHLNRYADGVPGAAVSTMVCVQIDVDSGELRYTCAGHPPPLLIEPDGTATYLLEGRGPPLASGHQTYREGTSIIRPDHAVMLYSDGAVERRHERLDDGLARLARLARRHVQETPQGLADAVIDGLFGTTAAPDDVAVLIARLERVPDRLHLALPGEPEQLAGIRRQMRAWLAQWRIDSILADDVVLSAMEACANAVEHGTHDGEAGSIEVAMQMLASPDAIEVEVRDHGRWRPPPADPGDRGHGLKIIRRLMDALDIDATDGGTRVRMRTAAQYAVSPVRLASPEHAPRLAAASQTATIDLVLGNDTLVGRLGGDIDDVAVTDMSNALAAQLRECAGCVLDLTDVTYFGSSAVSMLFAATATLRSRDLGLVVISPPHTVARRVIDLCGLGGVATIVNHGAIVASSSASGPGIGVRT